MLKLRLADINDLQLLNYWDTKQHVIDCDDDENWEWQKELNRNPDWREQLIAELNGEPIGFIQIIDPYLEETKYWGDVGKNIRAIDIWIGEEKNLNKGYGSIMMKLAAERCFAKAKVEKIIIDPLSTNTKAHRFYERLGFSFVAKANLQGSSCFIYELKRADWLISSNP